MQLLLLDHDAAVCSRRAAAPAHLWSDNGPELLGREIKVRLPRCPERTRLATSRSDGFHRLRGPHGCGGRPPA